MIKSFINKNATDWDVNINLLLAAYRSTPHPATGFSPNFLMLGREISIPIKLIHPLPDHKYGGQSEYAQHLQDRLQDVYQIARKHLKTNAERLKKNHDTRLTKYKYKKGDLVYKFDKTIRQKFKSPWLGPYLISKVLSTVVYEICFKTRTEVVHIDKLIPYPYVVIVSEDIKEVDEATFMKNQIFIQEEEIEIVEIKIDPKDEKIVELENKYIDLQSTHANQLKELEEKHKFECLRFGNFIERLEKRNTELKEEVRTLKNQLTCNSAKKMRSSVCVVNSRK
ncbi:Hypothetical predicted protein [Mytilus galloprovincialis]|uniref:Integrase p58-like C-terminal domain-containing protein n=1 Tax=Mytilus galloprovincialis TaxID=29158 RepID=A0A8B6CKU7_MYTGA|nr:Hypothetical predicted protein [Mytilus galloprovincialis]